MMKDIFYVLKKKVLSDLTAMQQEIQSLENKIETIYNLVEKNFIDTSLNQLSEIESEELMDLLSKILLEFLKREEQYEQETIERVGYV